MNLDLNKFEKIIKVTFKNKSLLSKALTHKSFSRNNNNEKLEFLGDRVIGLVLSKKLLDLYPKENEGILDKRFSKLVNRETCSSIAWSIEIQNFMIMGDSHKKVSRDDHKILSDGCEALIGAIYIDKGFNFVSKVVLNLWSKKISKSNITILDPKTKLQEYSLKLNKKLPIYKFLSSKGPRHNPTFKVSVSISGSKNFIGIGRSKQDAEQSSAKKLLDNIKDD